MEFDAVVSKRRSSVHQHQQGAAADSTSSSCLTLYQSAPDGEVALEEFERFALDRLRVLKGIEDTRAKGTKGKDLGSVILDLAKKHLQAATPDDTARKDIISHFVLRLAYCRSEELRRWFLAQESALFKTRFQAEPPAKQVGLDDMIDDSLPSLDGCQIAQTKLCSYLHRCQRSVALPGGQRLPLRVANRQREIAEDLKTVARAQKDKDFNQLGLADPGRQHYLKVPFQEVPELVAGRRVLLKKGFAYVPHDQLAAQIVGHLRTRLHWTAKVAPEERERLTPVVEALSARYLGADYSQARSGNGAQSVSLRELDTLAKESFPLCMRHLHNKASTCIIGLYVGVLGQVKEEHHLKHGGRMQLGLFLKGIGLSLEDAISFWREEFTKKVSGEKFQKEYMYGIRHNYGKEGKRADYTPYTCMKIINASPAAGDHHGCPYRHFSADNLRAALRTMRLSAGVVDGVMDKAKNHHYQLACASAFEGMHNCECETGINHPNQYFEESRKVLAPVESAQALPEAPAASTLTGSAGTETQAA
eukprot:jgi/Chlat1/8254/Chrsp77S07677